MKTILKIDAKTEKELILISNWIKENEKNFTSENIFSFLDDLKKEKPYFQTGEKSKNLYLIYIPKEFTHKISIHLTARLNKDTFSLRLEAKLHFKENLLGGILGDTLFLSERDFLNKIEKSKPTKKATKKAPANKPTKAERIIITTALKSAAKRRDTNNPMQRTRSIRRAQNEI